MRRIIAAGSAGLLMAEVAAHYRNCTDETCRANIKRELAEGGQLLVDAFDSLVEDGSEEPQAAEPAQEAPPAADDQDSEQVDAKICEHFGITQLKLDRYRDYYEDQARREGVVIDA